MAQSSESGHFVFFQILFCYIPVKQQPESVLNSLKIDVATNEMAMWGDRPSRRTTNGERREKKRVPDDIDIGPGKMGSSRSL